MSPEPGSHVCLAGLAVGLPPNLPCASDRCPALRRFLRPVSFPLRSTSASGRPEGRPPRSTPCGRWARREEGRPRWVWGNLSALRGERGTRPTSPVRPLSATLHPAACPSVPRYAISGHRHRQHRDERHNDWQGGQPARPRPPHHIARPTVERTHLDASSLSAARVRQRRDWSRSGRHTLAMRPGLGPRGPVSSCGRGSSGEGARVSQVTCQR